MSRHTFRSFVYDLRRSTINWVIWGGFVIIFIVLAFMEGRPEEAKATTQGSAATNALSLLWLYGAVGAVASGLFGVPFDLLASKIEEHRSKRLPPPADFFRNQHVSKQAGLAIEMILRDCAGDDVTSVDDRRELEKLAANARRTWERIVSHPARAAVPTGGHNDSMRDRWRELFEENLSAFIKDPRRAAFDDDTWMRFLIAAADGRAVTLSPQANAHVLRSLSTRFSEAFRLAIKRDFVIGGEGYVGLQLLLTGELLRKMQSTSVSGTPQGRRVLAEMKRSLGMLQQDVHAQLTRSNEYLAYLPEMARGVGEIAENTRLAADRLNELSRQLREQADPTVDVLPDDEPREPQFGSPYVPFVDRLIDRDEARAELRSWFDHLHDIDVPRVMVVRAGLGGMGKSLIAWQMWNECVHDRDQWAQHMFHGALWWSFWDEQQSVERFIDHALQYVYQRWATKFSQMDLITRTRHLCDALRTVPVLLVLDGLEQTTPFYTARQQGSPTIEGAPRTPPNRSPDEHALPQALRDVILTVLNDRTSRILMTTREVPEELRFLGDDLKEHCQKIEIGRIPSPYDVELLDIFVDGRAESLARIARELDGYPLLIQVLGRRVADDLVFNGDLDRWLVSDHGRQFNPGKELRLLEERGRYVVRYVLDNLSGGDLELLWVLRRDWRRLELATLIRRVVGGHEHAIAKTTDDLQLALKRLERRGLIEILRIGSGAVIQMLKPVQEATLPTDPEEPVRHYLRLVGAAEYEAANGVANDEVFPRLEDSGASLREFQLAGRLFRRGEWFPRVRNASDQLLTVSRYLHSGWHSAQLPNSIQHWTVLAWAGRRARDYYRCWFAQHSLVELLLSHGRLSEACAMAQQALAIAVANNDTYAESYSRIGMALVARHAGLTSVVLTELGAADALMAEEHTTRAYRARLDAALLRVAAQIDDGNPDAAAIALEAVSTLLGSANGNDASFAQVSQLGIYRAKYLVLNAKFADALDVLEDVISPSGRAEPNADTLIQAQLTRIQCLIELGRYDDADSAATSLHNHPMIASSPVQSLGLRLRQTNLSLKRGSTNASASAEHLCKMIGTTTHQVWPRALVTEANVLICQVVGAPPIDYPDFERRLADMLAALPPLVERERNTFAPTAPPLPPGITSTSGWTDDQAREALERVKSENLQWNQTEGSARNWWIAFENENAHRSRLVFRLAEELKIRSVSVTEFFRAYVYSKVDNIQANLDYVDYQRIYNEEWRGKDPSATPLIADVESGTIGSSSGAEDTMRQFVARFTELCTSEARIDPALIAEGSEVIDSLLDERLWRIGSEGAGGQARRWWGNFLAVGGRYLALVLADKLIERKASLQDWWDAIREANVRSPSGRFFYLNYMLVRREDEAKRLQRKQV